MPWISGVACAEASVPKTACTEASRSPDIPSAATVFAKVGASGLAAMASTSARWASMAASKAGRKCSGRISPKGGNPNGAVHSARSGFAAGPGDAGPADSARARMARVMRYTL